MELTVGYYDVEKNAIVAYDKPRQIASLFFHTVLSFYDKKATIGNCKNLTRL